MENIPYKVFETSQARADRRFKQMWTLVLVLLILLVGSNFGWLIYENQFDEITTATQTVTQDIDTNSGNAIINDGVHINGESETDSNEYSNP